MNTIYINYLKNRKLIKGFTLIELLVSMAIFATIAVVLYSSFRAGVVSYRRINLEGEFQQRLSYLFEAVTKDLKNMIYVSVVPFEGTEDRIAFVTTQSISDDIELDVARVSYYISSDNESSFLAREVGLIEDFLSSTLEEDVEEEEEIVSHDGVNPVTNLRSSDASSICNGVKLLDNVSSLKFSYLKIQENLDEEDETVEYEWMDIWEEENMVPAAVKIDIVFNSLDNSQKINLSKRVWIPVGCAEGDTQGEVEIIIE